MARVVAAYDNALDNAAAPFIMILTLMCAIFR